MRRAQAGGTVGSGPRDGVGVADLFCCCCFNLCLEEEVRKIAKKELRRRFTVWKSPKTTARLGRPLGRKSPFTHAEESRFRCTLKTHSTLKSNALSTKPAAKSLGNRLKVRCFRYVKRWKAQVAIAFHPFGSQAPQTDPDLVSG